MTPTEAQTARQNRTPVCAGAPGADDYDEGYIVELEDEQTAIVAWQCGVRTPCPVVDLALV